MTWAWNFFNQRLSLPFLSGAAFAALLSFLWFQAVLSDYRLIAWPEKAPFADPYVTGESSGYGIPESIAYFKEIASNRKIVLFTTSNWGNPADSVYDYLSGHPNIEIYMAPWVFQAPLLPPWIETLAVYQPFTDKFLRELQRRELPEVYFICCFCRSFPEFSPQLFARINPNFELVKAFPKPDGTFVTIYRLREPARKAVGYGSRG